MNPIFEKAAAAAAALRELGYGVEITTHPTSYGNSAYVRARRIDGRVFVEKGFRLSDHGVGDFRKGSDDLPTIIDGDDVTVADLVARSTVTDDEIEAARAAAAARRDEELERARANWAAAPGKIRRRFKQAGDTDDERALALLRQGTKW